MNSNPGLWSWLFQRISALFLVVGLAVHFIVLHFATTRPVSIEKISARFNGIGWIIFDSILLIICIYHALGGLNSIILDFSPPPRLKIFISYVFWLLGLLVAVVGIAILLAFRG